MTNSAAKQLASNTIWNAFEKFSQLGIQLLCTFILARFLTPSDFGIVGMLVIFTQISKTITDSGFSIAINKKKEVTKEDLSSIFYLNLILAVIIYWVLYFCSPYIAVFYHEPILNDVCKVTFLVIPIFALTLIQTTLLKRNLQFKKLSIITFVSSITASIVAVFLAYYYKNVWALVIQNLLTFAIEALLLWITTKWHPSLKFSMKSVSKYFKFSKNLLLTGLLGSVFNNINALLIGHFYTSTDLGFYSQANRINGIASHTSTDVIKSVSFPVLSKYYNNGGDLKSGYKKVILVTILFVGSIITLLMSISDDLFEILMGGPEWRLAGKYLFLLGLSGILYPLHAVNQNVLNVKGDSRTILFLEIIRRCILILILAIALQFSVPVFVASYSFYSFVLLFVNLHYCGKPINYSTKEQLIDIAPIIARLFLVLLFSFVCNSLFVSFSIYVRCFLTMVLSTLLLLLLFHRTKVFNEVLILLAGILKKEK